MNKKQAYEEKLQAQLDQWSAKIDILKAKASKAEADARVRYLETIEDLQAHRDSAKKQLQELHKAGDEAWEDLKDGIEEAWTSLESSIKSALSRFN